MLKPGSCITMITSESHRFAPVTSLDSIDGLASFNPLPSQFVSVDQYNISKLFMLLFAQCIHTEYEKYGIQCRAVHPGNLVWSQLARSWWLYTIIFFLVRPFTKSAEQVYYIYFLKRRRSLVLT